MGTGQSQRSCPHNLSLLPPLHAFLASPFLYFLGFPFFMLPWLFTFLYFLSPPFGYTLYEIGLAPTTSQEKGMQMGIHSRPTENCRLYNSLCMSSINSIRYQFQFSSVTQLCLTLCDPMNHSTLGFPVHHQLLESTQTHVH